MSDHIFDITEPVMDEYLSELLKPWLRPDGEEFEVTEEHKESLEEYSNYLEDLRAWLMLEPNPVRFLSNEIDQLGRYRKRVWE